MSVTLRKVARRRNVAIEPHPGIFSENPGKRRQGQRQHCLAGYFGVVGADRAVLVSRYEWPPQHPLMEVQGAMLRAWELGVKEFEAGGQTQALMQRPATGIARPLD